MEESCWRGTAASPAVGGPGESDHRGLDHHMGRTLLWPKGTTERSRDKEASCTCLLACVGSDLTSLQVMLWFRQDKGPPVPALGGSISAARTGNLAA